LEVKLRFLSGSMTDIIQSKNKKVPITQTNTYFDELNIWFFV